MKNLFKYFVLTLCLFTGFVNADQAVIPSESRVCCNQAELAKSIKLTKSKVKEFERLVKEALQAEKTSAGSLLGVDVLRGVIKCALIAAFMAGAQSYINDAEWYKNQSGSHDQEIKKLDAAAATVSFTGLALVPTGFDAMFYACTSGFGCDKDQVVDSMKKIKKYIKRLTPEQRAKAYDLFEEKYADQFRNKILREKDGKKLRVIRRLVSMIFDIVPTVIWAIAIHKKSEVCKKFGVKEDLSTNRLLAMGCTFSVVWAVMMYALKALEVTSSDVQREVLLKTIESELEK